MKPRYVEQKETHIGRIVRALPKSATPEVCEFTTLFFGSMWVEDLEALEPHQAAGMALSAYEFARARKANQPKVRVFTPTLRDDGYNSGRLVIEVINDDMPFLVDSLMAEIAHHGLTIHETIHPVFSPLRNARGELTSLSKGKIRESYIHFETSALSEAPRLRALEARLKHVLAHVRVAVADWQKLMKRTQELMVELPAMRASAPQVKEAQEFLRWLIDRNFIFLGYAEYVPSGKSMQPVAKTALGLLSIDDGARSLSEEMRLRMDSVVTNLIEITRSSHNTVVHRAVPMDIISLYARNAKGVVTKEYRLVGLFTSAMYYQSVDVIPVLRRKAAAVMARSGHELGSHDGKALKTILEFLPRDEVFQMSEEDLLETSMGILHLESKPRIRVFPRRDPYARFVSCMVFAPRELFSTALRIHIQSIIERAIHGKTTAFSTQIGEAPLARLHLIVETAPHTMPEVDWREVEAEITRHTRLWRDQLKSAASDVYGEAKAETMAQRFGAAFPEGYMHRYDIHSVLHDIEKVGQAMASGTLAIEMFRNKREDARVAHLKIYNPSEEIPLSAIVPMLENMGFTVIEEHPFLVRPQGRQEKTVWIRDFRLHLATAFPVNLIATKSLFEDAFLSVWRGECENDRFNSLVLYAGLNARQVTLVRALAKYCKQTGFAYAQGAIEQALCAHPELTRHLVELFEMRFYPRKVKDREAQCEALQGDIEQGLLHVTGLAEDRIVRRLLDLILATLRTNYFQAARPVLSFKFDSAKVPELPLPRPWCEIFVYSPRVEGIHLRGGKVARGGLRWSDRPDDFRTEILGLMKAQMVKNSVIVPVGSKGGFVLKRIPKEGGRDALQQEGIACYTLYLQGLLDITDNIVGSTVVSPKDVVRYDEDDPYLVVAADKGTASFSDIANGVSRDYGFWLDDAFASGGSAGYDHKEMGITARGAWVSVVRHFREMGVDIAKTPLTCVGIGDMSGDVFGNGMLLSGNIRLVAAFNHQHIFLDPNPDAKKSFAERKRIFHLARSSWAEYDKALISKGGGVYERSAKSIAIAKEVREALGIDATSLSPDDLIRAILQAPVDLLWNGGIGTYVKAEDETHDQVGDRANNAVRINGRELRCKVVGEGGNLGFTQKGRIEYARTGGRLNTDAIDNSAGVDCSDHEVNIKIAFSPLLTGKKLSRAARDTILESMTEEVAALVLKDNVLQTQAITIAELQGASQLEAQQRLMQSLEAEGLLNRAIEYLPADKTLAEMKASGKGLTRPEIAVLLAYSKLSLFRDLAESTLPDEPHFVGDLNRYFPKAMQEKFAGAIAAHRLRREIVATVMTNSIVNRVGMTFYNDLAEDTGLPARDIAAAYAVVRDAFGLRHIWNAIETAQNVIPAKVQVEMFAAVNHFVQHMALWFLRRLPQPLSVEMVLKEFVPGIDQFAKSLDDMHSQATRKAYGKQLVHFREQGAPEALAARMAGLEMMMSACDVIQIARDTKLGIAAVGTAYFALGAKLRLGWLRLNASRVATASRWERLAVQALINDLYDEQSRLARVMMGALGKQKLNAESVEQWQTCNQQDVERYLKFLEELRSVGTIDVPVLMVALRHVKGLCGV